MEAVGRIYWLFRMLWNAWALEILFNMLGDCWAHLLVVSHAVECLGSGDTLQHA